MPKCLFMAKTDVLFSFISGYFDADGSAVGSKKVYKFCSIDQGILQDIQRILLAHGVSSTIHIEDRSRYGWKDLATLSINGRRSQERLAHLCELRCNA